MVNETISTATELFEEWRCLNCGDIVDPLILENRQKAMMETLAAAA
jgi:hypothetical protein